MNLRNALSKLPINQSKEYLLNIARNKGNKTWPNALGREPTIVHCHRNLDIFEENTKFLWPEWNYL